MEIAEIILEYIKAFIWPCLILFIAIRYRKSFDRLIERLCEETEEISSSSLGITAKFSKVADDISKISKELPADQQQAKEALIDTRKEILQNQLRELSKDFLALGIRGRQRTARNVYDLATEVDLDFILSLSASESPGERVASGICLEAHLNINDTLLSNDKISQAIRKGLKDAYSRVRYRYVHAITSRDELISRYQNELRKISLKDSNDAVRELARRCLDEI
jgi:hypothetical protein